MGKQLSLLTNLLIIFMTATLFVAVPVQNSVASTNTCQPGKRANAYCDYETGGSIRNRQAIISGQASGIGGGGVPGGPGATTRNPGSSGSSGSAGNSGSQGSPGGSVRTGMNTSRPWVRLYPVISNPVPHLGGICVIWAGDTYAPVDCATDAVPGTPGTPRVPGGSSSGPSTPADPRDRLVTLNDIAHFTPQPPIAMMEPNGWTVAKLETNFFSSSRAHDRAGELFSLPVTVRFTPIEYRWSYGEGGSAVHRVPGDTWAHQGLGEFAATPTSYRFAELGNYTIRHQVLFIASYRFNGTQWRNIAGTILLPANDLHIIVGSAETLLFELDCAENPAGLGC